MNEYPLLPEMFQEMHENPDGKAQYLLQIIIKPPPTLKFSLSVHKLSTYIGRKTEKENKSQKKSSDILNCSSC